MKTDYTNIMKSEYSWKCITTNGFVSKAGRAVMGRGIALALRDSVKGVSERFGSKIKKNGNIVQYIEQEYIAYPVKPVNKVITDINQVVKHAREYYKVGDTVPGFHCLAELSIIERSAIQIVALADRDNLDNIVIPRPGCGAGGLDYVDVYERIYDILDDRFTVATFRNTRMPSKKVFISGSRSINLLSDEACYAIRRYIAQDAIFLVGDCYGVDQLIQEYINSLNYNKVIVYHIGRVPRNNIGFKSVRVKGDKYIDKDIAMSLEADEGLAIWDGNSRGTKQNIQRMKRQNKQTRVINNNID